MATNTTLQKLDILDSDGNAFGVNTSNRRQVETFISDGAIGLGDLVTFDVVDGGGAECVIKVIESPANKSAIGVALNAAAGAGEDVRVCISGICEAQVEGKDQAGNAAISAGDYLCVGAVAGTLYKYGHHANDKVPVAIAVDALSGGDAAAQKTVVFLKQF